MKFAALAAAGLLAVTSTPVLAQSAPPPPTASAPVTVASQPLDPERVALAKELLSVLDVKAMLQGMYGKMLSALKTPDGLSEDQQARIKQLVASMKTGLDATIPDSVGIAVDIYARNLTADEMRSSLAFYRSEAGQAILKKAPMLTQQAMTESMKLMPKVWATAKADYCSHRTCDKQDETIFAAIGKMYGVPDAAH